MPVSSFSKIALHLSRLAAAQSANAAHQSTSGLRGAFQSSSSTAGAGAGSSGAGTGSSGWAQGLSSSGSSAGAGAGGAKYHAGRGAQYGYQGTGRALTHANATSSTDSSTTRNEDDDERRLGQLPESGSRSGKPFRRMSVSSSGPGAGVLLSSERGLTTGALTSVQMQARYRHAFAAKQSQSLITAADAEKSTQSPVSATRARSNSTSALGAAPRDDHSPSDLPETPLPPDKSDEAISDSNAVAQSRNSRSFPPFYTQLVTARKDKDASRVHSLVNSLRASPMESQSTASFNAAMEALLSIRKSGQSIRDITDAYLQMINNDLLPNSRTFSVVIRALCARDAEIQHLLSKAKTAKAKASAQGLSNTNSVPDSDSMERFREEDNFGQALQLFSVAHTSHSWFPDATAYNALLRSCALRGDAEHALTVLDSLERSGFAKADAHSYKHLIAAFANDANPNSGETPEEHAARKLKTCQQVHAEFLQNCATDASWNHSQNALPWNGLIEAHFALNDPAGAVAAFERMITGEAPQPMDKDSSIATAEAQAESDSAQPAQPALSPARAPVVPTSHTISTIILGFTRSGDLETATAWLERVAATNTAAAVGEPAFPMPYKMAFVELLNRLVEARQVEDATRVFKMMLETAERHQDWEDISFSDLDRVLGLHATEIEAAIAANDTVRADATLDSSLDLIDMQYTLFGNNLRGLPEKPIVRHARRLNEIIDLLTRRQRIVDAGAVLTYAAHAVSVSTRASDMIMIKDEIRRTSAPIVGITDWTVKGAMMEPLPADPVTHLIAAAETVGGALRDMFFYPIEFGPHIARLYLLAREAHGGDVSHLALSNRGWGNIVDGMCRVEEANDYDLPASRERGLALVLGDIAKLDASLRPEIDWSRPATVLMTKHGEDAKDLLEGCIPGMAGVIQAQPWLHQGVAGVQQVAAPLSDTDQSSHSLGRSSQDDAATQASTVPTPPMPPIHNNNPLPDAQAANLPVIQVIDTDLGKEIEDLVRPGGQPDPEKAYKKLMTGLETGTYPNPEALAALMNAYGRIRRADTVRELYAMANHVIAGLAANPGWQANAWYSTEDGMIMALAHAGDADAASVHRHRLIQAGKAPSASAYAALIATVKDTTDDALVAEELFEESQRLGVRPHTYLFNTVISKLSRARKAERALELFNAMTSPQLRLRPTSVTFGAVINACTRIGDEENAVRLFEQMSRDKSFKARVPPFNTMIQFYVQTKPDREKALKYYNQLKSFRVPPSAHTYKLLLDTYGSIEPVDTNALERTFQKLVDDRSVQVQGTHWASLIHSWGCVRKDLDRAVEIFETIASHPSSASSRTPLPDAVAYESLLSVFVAHHRTDLMHPYLDRMREAGIHLTAYVANLLIRGYAQEGRLDAARAVFEQMQDPAAGIAASGNHPPRQPGAGAGVIADAVVQDSLGLTGTGTSFAEVFREPSTYEAMIRAELGEGGRARALALVERMEQRAFPPALVVRARSLIADEPPSLELAA